MNQRWTLHVENFARIESADIEISPLMCFIGDNNSGKSYIMSLLWGLLHHSWYFLFSDNGVAVKRQEDCRRWREQFNGQKCFIDDNAAQKYVALFNDLLDINKEKIITDIFNREISVGKIEIRNFKTLNVASFYCSSSELTIKNSEQVFKVSGNYQKWVNADFAICWSLIMGGLTTPYPIEEATGLPIYLPASRTGFLLTRREIATRSISRNFSLQSEDKKIRETLTSPYIQFLQMINSLTDSPKNHSEEKMSLINFLQKEIIHGDIKVKADGKIINYSPEDVKSDELPMSLTSSVVTETAALLLMLTNRLYFRLVVIEEPEAHLHPALQKKIAQLLIRFVHSGIPIWITTHSDTILQHFNNMIKLNNRQVEEREKLLKEFNYTSDDLLTAEEIRLYQFERGNERTKIQKLESGKYGFVANLFNKAIDELVAEIYAFQEDE